MNVLLLAVVAILSLCTPTEEIPDPPTAEERIAMHKADAEEWSKHPVDTRTIDACTREEWDKAAVNEDEFGGLMCNLEGVKDGRVFGGSCLMLYTDSELPHLVYLHATDENVLQSLRAADKTLIRVRGRWAPTVRYSEEVAAKIAKDWHFLQHPSDMEAPTTWGGGFIVDEIVPTEAKPTDRQDMRYSGGGWQIDSTRFARVSGTLRCEEVENGSGPKFKQQRYMLETEDGRLIPVRMIYRQDKLVDKKVTVDGYWMRLFVCPADRFRDAECGPVLKQHPNDESLVIAGGGIRAMKIVLAETGEGKQETGEPRNEAKPQPPNTQP